ncbi:MAG: hypothetical protein GY757_37535, partial [bacterium]|nr:hypothetical protein [bacterium]
MKTQKNETEYATIYKSGGTSPFIKMDIAIIKDLSQIGPYCGAYCMGYYSFWFVEDEKRKTILLDRDRFHTLLESCYQLENDRILNYDQLPQFITEHNECKEWA